MMKEYINKVGESIPNTLKISQRSECITDQNTLFFFGFFEYTGFRGFFKKVQQGIKARSWQK